MENYNGYALDWETEIDTDGSGEFFILPEGDYPFTVISFERKQFPGSNKIPPCKKATLTLRVETENLDTAIIYHDLILYSTLMWKIAEFFRSIGQKKHGEAVRPNWNEVVGSSGKAHFKPHTYKNKNGEEKTVNSVDKFYDYEGPVTSAPVQAPDTATVGIPKWTGGKF